MAIHAKSNGLLIGGKIIEETEQYWVFHARDNKRPTYVKKSDTKARVFPDKEPIANILNWQDQARGGNQ